ncbi:MAG: NUDIX hydrolase [Cyclobacteriaceae bacterium]
MADIKNQLVEKFGNRLRTRVNGILTIDNKILMVKHLMGEGRIFWNVPGGGMEYGQSAIENLKREFREETGLKIEVREFLFVHEHLAPPLHAIELFFVVHNIKGNLIKGLDPELVPHEQLIDEIRFMETNEIKSIKDTDKHAIFRGINSINDIRKWKGNFNFENNCIK